MTMMMTTTQHYYTHIRRLKELYSWRRKTIQHNLAASFRFLQMHIASTHVSHFLRHGRQRRSLQRSLHMHYTTYVYYEFMLPHAQHTANLCRRISVFSTKKKKKNFSLPVIFSSLKAHKSFSVSMATPLRFIHTHATTANTYSRIVQIHGSFFILFNVDVSTVLISGLSRQTKA